MSSQVTSQVIQVTSQVSTLQSAIVAAVTMPSATAPIPTPYIEATTTGIKVASGVCSNQEAEYRDVDCRRAVGAIVE